jgi:hypothetical protein
MATALDAAQAALAAEHAAVYGYGLAGGKLSGGARRRALAGYDAHRSRRDRVAQLVRDLGGEPAPAAAGYSPPFPVAGAADAARLAVRLEEAVAAAHADLVAAGDQQVRTLAARALQEAAVRAAAWRGTSVAFPGLPEAAGR